MNKLLATLILAGGIVCSLPRAHAIGPGLVAGDSAFGSGTLTLDTTTGLRWLDLPLTVGLNRPQMEAALLPGGNFSGFRYATRAEVEGLWVSAGIPYTGVGISIPEMQANFGPVTALEALLGLTGGGTTTGIVSDVNPSNPSMSLRPMLWQPGPGWAMAAVNEWASASSSPSIGHWLVQVPEPAITALWGIAAITWLIRRSPRRPVGA